jgi:hypothetical protein
MFYFNYNTGSQNLGGNNQGIILSSDTATACYSLRIDAPISKYLATQTNAFRSVSTSSSQNGGLRTSTAISLT